MSEDDDIDFELVTNASQFAPPAAMGRERVILPNLKTTSGRVAAVYVQELTAREYYEHQDALRVYEDGRFTGINHKNDDLKLLAIAVRDPNGNRLWPTAKVAIEQLGRYGQKSINTLLEAYVRMNRPADEESAEGNSEPTPSDS